MPRELVMTGVTEIILGALVADPTADHHGAALHHNTGLPTGRIFPVLARLETLNWLDSGWDEPTSSEQGWPRRRWYRLSEQGLAMARGALASARSSSSMKVARLRTAGGTT